MTVHELKTWPEQFQAIRNGSKTFDYRKNDREFKSGDQLALREWDPKDEAYTGRTIYTDIGYMLHGGFGVPDGYIVLSLLNVSTATWNPDD